MPSIRAARVYARALFKTPLLICVAGVSAAAGASTYEPTGLNLGISSFNDGFGTTEPGLTLLETISYNDNDRFYVNGGHQNPLFSDPNVTAVSLLSQFAYTTPYRLFGGSVGLTTLIPIVYLHARDAGGSAVPLTSNTGIGAGNIWLGAYLQYDPVISDGRPVFVQRFEFYAVTPTGSYDSQKLVNQSTDYWSINPHYVFTVLPTPKTEISVRLQYLYNFSNHNPGVNNSDGYPGSVSSFTAGQAVLGNFAASYKVLPNLNVGINGFWFRQITDDRVNGQSQTNDRTTRLSIGPGAEWTIDRKNFVFFNAYFPVVARDTQSGFQAGVRWIHQF